MQADLAVYLPNLAIAQDYTSDRSRNMPESEGQQVFALIIWLHVIACFLVLQTKNKTGRMRPTD